MPSNNCLLRWPWGLWSRGDDIVAIDSSKEIPYSGANLLTNIAASHLSAYAEPFTKHVSSEPQHFLYELAHDTRNSGRIEVFLDEERTLTLQGFSRKTETSKDQPTYVDQWASFFEELFYARGEHNKKENTYSWHDIKSFIERSLEQSKEAKLALIVEISLKFRTSISNIVNGMNATLKRERSLQDISQVKEFDTQSLRWISKHPGESLREKIGDQNKILAVRRFKNYDSYENRVLKDFLIRCRKEASRYVKNTHTQFSRSERVVAVRTFSETCSALLKDERFLQVGPPNLSQPPNYVVLHNARYRMVWTYYMRLLRLQEDRDDLWRWQNRTWGEIARLLVSVCLYGISEMSNVNFDYQLESLLEGEPVLNHQQIRGLRLLPGCEPGPFLLHRNNLSFILDVVSAEHSAQHPYTKDLGDLGARLFLVCNPVDTLIKEVPVIAVWSINSIASTNNLSREKISESLVCALENINRRLIEIKSTVKVWGLVFVNGSDNFDLRDGTLHSLVFCPVDFHKWGIGLKDTIPLVLDDLLQRMTA